MKTVCKSTIWRTHFVWRPIFRNLQRQRMVTALCTWSDCCAMYLHSSSFCHTKYVCTHLFLFVREYCIASKNHCKCDVVRHKWTLQPALDMLLVLQIARQTVVSISGWRASHIHFAVNQQSSLVLHVFVTSTGGGGGSGVGDRSGDPPLRGAV